MKRSLSVAVLLVLALAGARTLFSEEKPASAAKASADIEATVVGVEYRGAKLWLPGTIFAKKGQRVRITVMNKIPGEGTTHGFAIDVFGVKKVIATESTEVVEFVADQAGIFPLYCHQHPAHVGGQVVVLDK